MSRIDPILLAVSLLAVCGAAACEPLADPTRPAGARAPEPRRGDALLRVEGVIRGERDLAIVSGKLVRVGDHVDGARIDAILPDGVRYSRAGRSYTSRLPQTIAPVRRNAAATEDAP